VLELVANIAVEYVPAGQKRQPPPVLYDPDPQFIQTDDDVAPMAVE
jgi:hypothetical protein